MPKKQTLITKASGNIAVFSKAKLEKSLLRAGAFKSLAKKIAREVEKNIVAGMSTQDIYNLAFILLKKEKERPVAARYSLKKAIMALGPTGFPFERFIGELLARKGLKTKVGVVIQGACVPHEVDVIAKDGQNHYFLECKFHNRSGIPTNVKVSLYVHSRFQDIMKRIKKEKDCHAFHQAWVVTNTRLTKDAIKYGECNDMKMLGWRYPKNGGVEALIEDAGLHPLTCLTSLNDREKKSLLDSGTVLSKDIPKKIDFLKSLGIGNKRLKQLLKETEDVCSSHLTT